MTKVISTINLKGGVGKTQMTIALAEFLALEFDKRVLLIDLDPQTNATVALISQTDWKDRDDRGKTLLQLFKDQLTNDPPKFKVHESIIHRVSTIGGGIKNLDLLPSSLGLIELQDDFGAVATRKFRNPVTILEEALGKTSEKYDFVLIDCPPNLAMLTMNGVYISNYYLIPCIPDFLSTYGIPSIINRINRFKRDTGAKIKGLGIIISMYRAQTKFHQSQIEKLEENVQKGDYPRIFDTKIPLAIKIAESADFELKPNTLKQKYGYTGMYENYLALTKEFLDEVKK